MGSGSWKVGRVVHAIVPCELSLSLLLFPQLPVGCRGFSEDTMALGWRKPGFPGHFMEGHLPRAHIGVLLGKKNTAVVV